MSFAGERTPAYKVAVTGGPWEFAHNQLCFFNHFSQLQGQGMFTYVPLLDQLIEPERDLQDIDAVIISRGRHANLRRVLDYCRKQSIATMCMIDDNWFAVGRDWPEPYASIFAPGLPQYEMFLSCLRECDATLVYNDVLAEDVQSYARRVIRLPVNVRQADFAAPLRHPELKCKIEGLTEWRRQTGGLVAGYIGSFRYDDAAFQALAAATRSRWLPVKVVLFGVVSDEQRQIFGSNAVVLPYVGYDHYAAAVGTLLPDILVAPLDSTRNVDVQVPEQVSGVLDRRSRRRLQQHSPVFADDHRRPDGAVGQRRQSILDGGDPAAGGRRLAAAVDCGRRAPRRDCSVSRPA